MSHGHAHQHDHELHGHSHEHAPDKPAVPAMQPLRQAWYYWALVALLLAQVAFSVMTHVLVCNLTIANTLFLLIILAHRAFNFTETSRPLLQGVCGCVAFVAVLFVNITHAMEMLTENFTDEPSDHVHDDLVPYNYFILSIVDVLLKLVMLASANLPQLGLALPCRLVLHTMAPLVVIGMYLSSSLHIHSWAWDHRDPIAAVTETLVFVACIIPAFLELKPYIFADEPTSFDTDSFQKDIEKNFENVSCAHIHVYRLWPGSRFEALIHINIKVDKAEAGWTVAAQRKYTDVSKHITSVLSKGGAQKVVVEPRFVDPDDDTTWVGCVGETCFRQDRGCCKNNNEETASV